MSDGLTYDLYCPFSKDLKKCNNKCAIFNIANESCSIKTISVELEAMSAELLHIEINTRTIS